MCVERIRAQKVSGAVVLQIHKPSHAAAQGASDDALLSRVALALEELAEWVLAHADQDLKSAAAWVDRCYVLVGDAVANEGLFPVPPPSQPMGSLVALIATLIGGVVPRRRIHGQMGRTFH